MRSRKLVNVARRLRAGLLLVGLLASASDCLQRTEVARDYPLASAGSGGSGAGQSGASGSSAGGGLPSHVCQITACQGKVYQCGDCVDNDDDNLTDSEELECTGPCDNTESSFFGGIPGQNKAPCREDCYFDADSGSGNDQCYWHQACDPLSIAPEFPPSGSEQCGYDVATVIPGSGGGCAELSTAQSSECTSICLPLTPNGCDCFGCCELPAASGKFVWIGSENEGAGSCDAAHLSDPASCHPCTPVPSCLNRCEPCEVCVGRGTPAADCATPSTGRCELDQAACGQPGEADCDPGYYCITGCCAAAPR